MQVPPKPLTVFVAHSIALTLLLGFWQTPRDAYPALFHAHANAVLGWCVQLAAPAPGSDITTDTVVISAERRGAEPAWRSWFSVRRIGWWPSAALVAMLLATPISPARRALAMLAGLALLDAFTLARIGVQIAYAGYELDQGPGAPARGLLHLLLRVGSESLTATIPSAAFVFVCWVALARPRQSIDLTSVRTRLGFGPART